MKDIQSAIELKIIMSDFEMLPSAGQMLVHRPCQGQVIVFAQGQYVTLVDAMIAGAVHEMRCEASRG